MENSIQWTAKCSFQSRYINSWDKEKPSADGYCICSPRSVQTGKLEWEKYSKERHR